ncbi:MAG TPA: 4-hydroxy-3-methylbut-2-enyl diphosphate reductase, partial [Planctomycetota bacterium]|nr:4-hydroxy-3-methylbut-2-enyl diphosphate reductase [Planctomycetota bacterium]
MQVIVAESLGMCFGVRDAVAATRSIENPGRVTIYGELVHNEAIRAELSHRGFVETPEDRRDELPETPEVLVTAHGVSDRVRSRLERAGKRVLDTTCPLVKRAHQAARALADEGYHVLII